MLIAEDGTGTAGANAFDTLANIEAWLSARGMTAFAALPTETKEAAIINASEWLSDSYGWIGLRLLNTQGLAWPRRATYRAPTVPAGVPPQIKAAVARLANMLASTPGASLYGTVSGSDIIRRAKAGSVEVEFADGAASYMLLGRDHIPWLSHLLAGLTTTADEPVSPNAIGVAWIDRA